MSDRKIFLPLFVAWDWFAVVFARSMRYLEAFIIIITYTEIWVLVIFFFPLRCCSAFVMAWFFVVSFWTDRENHILDQLKKKDFAWWVYNA